MKRMILALICLLFPLTSSLIFGQDSTNCFLSDYKPKTAVMPPFVDSNKTALPATVTFTIDNSDTLGKITNAMFGNAFPSWCGNVTTDPVLLKYLRELNLSFIRFPGGSWSDSYFWDGKAADVPPLVWDGNSNKWADFTPFLGKGTWVTTLDNYYAMRDSLGTQGLITVNYSYARYGTSSNPVAQAAHYAADWVRYDNGRTLYWEIGNENAGPWEPGWRIDTSLNKDGQPEFITGALYGQHFKIFADSMRAAAMEFGAAIYIGCQVLHFDATYDGNTANRKWNQGVFQEAGDSPDFYVMHNYYGNRLTLFKYQVDNARTEIIKNINFIRHDIKNKNAASRPVAITEWNCNGPDAAKTSIANGAQAVVLFSEMIKNNFGMSCRWPIANWETDGLLYRGNDTSIPAWSPRPDYFYIYYLEKFTGDHVINTSSTNAGDLLAYATTFSSGQEAIVVVNKGVTNEVVQLVPKDYGFGNKYYVYTLVGGDNLNFSQSVSVNGVGAGDSTWGPIENLPNIKAFAYSSADSVIKFESPYRSVEYIMLEPGNNTVVSVGGSNNAPVVSDYSLNQNYPNPFNPSTTISYQLPVSTEVTLIVFNILGKEVAVLLNKDYESAGRHQISFDASSSGIYLSSGIYFYSIRAGSFYSTKKMILLK